MKFTAEISSKEFVDYVRCRYIRYNLTYEEVKEIFNFE